jgi:flagellar protein FliO/FliZ
MKPNFRFSYLAVALIAGNLASAALASSNAPAAVDIAPVNIAQMIVSLLVIIGVLVGLAVLFKKVGLNRMMAGLPFKVVGAFHLGHNQRVVVLDTGTEWLVLGVTPHHISAITTLPRQDSLVTNTGDLPFSKWINNVVKKK